MIINYDKVKEFDSQGNIEMKSWVKQELPKYSLLDPKKKGMYGEQFFLSCLHERTGVKWNNNNDDHDFVINGKKIELKFSVASNKDGVGIVDKFTFNHIATHKNWDYLVLIGINPPLELAHVRRGYEYEESVRAYAISKQDFVENLDYHLEQGLIKHQQGGKSGGLDDYIVGDYQKILEWKGIQPLHEII
jgi:hypothetical protein